MTIDLSFAKGAILLANIVLIVIRAPHGRRSRTVRVVKSRKGTREIILLTIAWLAFFLQLIWIATPVFSFADYPLYLPPFIAGVVLLALGLWLFYRSHADLGTNWSITLQVREQHQLVTRGVYRWVRHPMYLAMLTFALGQLLATPNWLVGPFYTAAVILLLALRMGPEERMMLEEFGKDYEAYMATTKRLIPGIW